MEHFIHCRHQFAYKVIKTLQKQGKDKVHINNIPEGKYIEYYKGLWHCKKVEMTKVKKFYLKIQ